MQRNENVTIKEMYREERPYEKCEQYGAENLTDAELLAVLVANRNKRGEFTPARTEDPASGDRSGWSCEPSAMDSGTASCRSGGSAK